MCVCIYLYRYIYIIKKTLYNTYLNILSAFTNFGKRVAGVEVCTFSLVNDCKMKITIVGESTHFGIVIFFVYFNYIL